MKKFQLFMFSVVLTFCFTLNTFAAHLNFTSYLTGEQETPVVMTTAKGTGTFTLTPAGGLRYSVTVNGLSGIITAAHFHMGSLKMNGPVVYDITGSFTGTTATGTISAPLPDSIIAALFTGRMYVNVHTASNPGGEIRGQVNLSAGTNLIARMDGLQETPSLINGGKGIASITLGSVGSAGLAYSISVNGLSGPVTAAHFHIGKIGEAGPVVKDIMPSFNGENALGVWRTSGPSPLTDSLIVALLNNKLYINIHTAANPGGEIRGQVVLASGFGANANLNGASENPPVITSATGTSEITFTDYGLVYSITVNGLSGPVTSAHIHNGDSGINGPVVLDITNRFSNNTATGIWKASGAAGDLTPSMMKDLFANKLYINVHTASNPSGEIRGQIKMKAGSGIGAFFTGAQEVPAPVITTASGTAALYTISTGLQYFITVTGLSGPITSAHFHLGSVKEGGPVVKDITASFTGNTATGVWLIAEATPFNDSLRRALVNGRIYLNVHTAANPSGEIRGQVFLTAGGGMTSNLDGNQEVPSVVTSSKGTGQYTLTRGGLGFNIAFNGLSGPVTAAHFHIGEPGKSGPVVFDLASSLNGNNIVGYWRPVVSVDSLFNALLNGKIYVNVHTAANPSGEIRGQVIVSEGVGLTVQLTGSQQNPPVTTNARGTGSATLTDPGLIFYNTFDMLSSPVTAVHFHNAPAGTNGPVVRDLMSNLNGNSVTGAWKRVETMTPITNALIAEAYNQNIYINLHTVNNPGGEIRGQLRSGSLNIIPYQIITGLIMTPENAGLPVNTQYCLTAAVTDESGNPVRNAGINFTIKGANAGAGSATTDSNGVATFCYTGIMTGRDTIIGNVAGVMDTSFVNWDNPLPVELSSFAHSVNKNNVILNWTTSEEINNSGFDIERKKLNTEEWSKVGFMNGSGGTNKIVDYTFTDKNVLSGKYNYRLKQVDFNGNFEYFNLNSEVVISIPGKYNLSQNYPNPFNPSTKIDFELPVDGNVSIALFDISGRMVATMMNEFKTAGYYTIGFNASNLSSGIYFYRLQATGFNKVMKLTLIK